MSLSGVGGIIDLGEPKGFIDECIVNELTDQQSMRE